MKKPLIGLTASHDQKTGELRINSLYLKVLLKCGALPFVLPPVLSAGQCEEAVTVLDGILLSGGPDIHPFHFGEETMKGCGDLSPLRDATELALVRAVHQRRIPLLGICRGMQLMNVALGGDIYQDLDTQLPNRLPIAHRQPFHPSEPSHRVVLEPDSLLAAISGQQSLSVNSSHHQAVRRPASCLRVSGRASDRVIEALEQSDYPFLIGVQWHPELLFHTQEPARRLFEAFVKACSHYAQTFSS